MIFLEPPHMAYVDTEGWAIDSNTNTAVHPHAGTIGWAYLKSKMSPFATGRKSPGAKGTIVKRKLSRLAFTWSKVM